MKRVGIWLAGLGALLAVAAVVSFVAIIDTDAGDVQAIESSLTPAPSEASAAASPVEQSANTPATAPESSATVEANQVSRLDELTGADRVPVGIKIGSLEVEAPIEGYGIDQRTGLMDVPDNVSEVGWYRHGPAPGEPGSAVLAAHVDLQSQGPGVFFDLKSLDPGELIEVTFDDGSVRRFQVKARNTYLKDELPLDVIFSRGGSSVLTLITCGGGFSASEATYDSNVVVYAVPLDSEGDVLPLS